MPSSLVARGGRVVERTRETVMTTVRIIDCLAALMFGVITFAGPIAGT
jgi:hypothetical protein